jgi:hypothetical protein
LTPSESKLKRLEIERSKLKKIVRQEKILSLKLSMISAILRLFHKLEADLKKNKERLTNAGNPKMQNEKPYIVGEQ